MKFALVDTSVNCFIIVVLYSMKNFFPTYTRNMLLIKLKNMKKILLELAQGRSQPHSPGWARVPLSSFFPQISIIFSYFSSNFSQFLPQFGSPGGRLAHPGRPWLRHWISIKVLITILHGYVISRNNDAKAKNHIYTAIRCLDSENL